MKNSFKTAVTALSEPIRSLLLSLPESLKREVREVRLRSERPLSLVADSGTYFLSRNGVHKSLPASPFIPTTQQTGECLISICDYSLYSRQNEIVEGFITLRGGSRAGLCGTAVIENGRITNVKNFSSINLRIASERLGCSQAVSARADIEKGLLLCGAPCSGKTTILRDIARLISEEKRVSLIDSRGEIAAMYKGIPQNDVGMCDVLDGYSRADGFEIAVRCLSPEIVICDEIGADDIDSLRNAALGGVAVIASVHSSSPMELMKKKGMKRLINTGVFESAVFLKDGKNVGQICEVIKAENLVD